MDDLYADESVVTRAERPPEDIHGVLILRLPITAIHSLGGSFYIGRCRSDLAIAGLTWLFGHKPILVVIPTLLDERG